MEHYAKIIEDNGGGITVYVMQSDGACIYAHSGYEYGDPRQLLLDIDSLLTDDSVADWEGNEEELVAEWPTLDLDTPHHRQVIASVADGELTTYPTRMGRAGHDIFDA